MGKCTLRYFGDLFKDMKIVLASKSPRRKEILSSLGLTFDIIVADADERSDELDPKKRVAALAAIKGRAVSGTLSDQKDTLIIASDTLVFACGEFLGKPKDKEDARRMIKLLSGREHLVVSGLYLSYNGKEVLCADETKVIFDKMTASEIESYIDSDEPYDKAGGYAVQGLASLYIRGLEGDYFNVVGLPVNLLYKTLKNEFEINLNDLRG